MRLLRSLILGATIAAWVVTTAATAPEPEFVQGQAHAAPQARAAAGLGRPALACWAEKVHGDITDVEIICGDPSDRPRTDTADIGQTIYPIADPLDGGREPWVVTVTGLEPDSFN